MNLKFNKGDILTTKEGYRVNVNKFLTTWVSIGDTNDYVIDYINHKKICLILETWDNNDIGPCAYECVINNKKGFILIVESNEDYLVKVN